ncbi:MAG: hypothetical protein AB7S41_07060 [Parvibaculaceae bacterium]
MTTLTPVSSDQRTCRGGHAAPGAAGWLGLAAAPTFAAMALWSGLFGSPTDICTGMPNASPLDGMTLMYALMSVFHAGAWLRPISSLLQS